MLVVCSEKSDSLVKSVFSGSFRSSGYKGKLLTTDCRGLLSLRKGPSELGTRGGDQYSSNFRLTPPILPRGSLFHHVPSSSDRLTSVTFQWVGPTLKGEDTVSWVSNGHF